MSRKKPGPKGFLKNPRPVELQSVTDDGRDVPLGTTDEIGPVELDYAERGLRDYFKERQKRLLPRPGEALSAAVWRITRIAIDALSEAGIGSWSGYAREKVEDIPDQPRVSVPWGRGGARRHVGPKPPPKAEHKCLWLDTSTMPAMLKQHDKHSQSWRSVFEVDKSIAADKLAAEKFVADMTRPVSWLLKTSWPLVLIALRDPVARMLRGEMGRVGKSGRPAYLASATLGALLDTTPEKLADFLANYRRRKAKP